MSISINKKYSFEISINSPTILVRNHSQLNQLDYESSGHTGFASSDEFSSHIENTNNPHSVTKAQVGLEDVEDGAQINIIEKVNIDGVDLTPDVDKRITLPNKEPAFEKNTAFNRNFGNENDTVCEGNDARLSDARTPLSHTHGDITNEGKIGSTADRVVVTTDDGKITTASRSGIDSRSTFPPDAHTHDDRYYTESEVDTALGFKVDKVADKSLVLDTEIAHLVALDTQAELNIKFGAKEDIANKGVANGYAPLNTSGIVDPIYVPGAYTDYVEYATYADLPTTGSEGTLYVVIADETSGGNTSTYRWTGSVYVNVTDKLSASEVKALYESNANTNAYTDDEKTKLTNIEPNAEVNNISDADASELTGGEETDLHKHTAADVNITDTGEHYDSTDVEGVLQDVGSELASITSHIEGLEDSIDGLDERVTNIENEVIPLPTYWSEAYLPDKINAIKALQNEGGKDCFSFVVMTDLHYPSNLGKRSPAIAKRILDKCNIKYALCLGDVQTRGCYQTKEEILAENEQVREMFAPIKDRLLQIEGNHDGSYYWDGGVVGSGTAYVKQLTEQEMFEEYYRANGLSHDVHFDENSNAFYADDVSNKVRYIGLNSMNVPNSKTDVNADGTAKYPKMHKTQFLQAQYDYLCNEALVTVPSDAWSVVVFGHSGIYNAGDYSVMVDVLSAYKDKTNCVVEYAGTADGGADYTNLANPADAVWKNGYRFNLSGVETADSTNSPGPAFASNYIPITSGQTLHIKGLAISANGGTTYSRMPLYNSSYEYLALAIIQNVSTDGGFTVALAEYDPTVVLITVGYPGVAYLRVGGYLFADGSPNDVIMTVNEPIVEAEHGYDYVSVNHDFSNAKGKFIAYFHGHEHQDNDYTRDSIKDIATRCDAQEEYEGADRDERVEGTITEQSFDVFTVNKAKRKIYATKIGAGSDRQVDY